MQWQRFLTYLIWLFSVRRKRDFVFKVSVLLLLAQVMHFGAQAMLSGIDPDTFWERVAINTIVALPLLCLGALLISHLERLQNKLSALAATDMLTGLPNRRAFFEQARMRMRTAQSGCIVLIDADHFKAINDQYGHAVGDLCLKALAQHLTNVAAPNTLIGRIGGEEFAAFHHNLSRDQVERMGAGFVGPVYASQDGHDPPVIFTTSVGASETRADRSIEETMKQADLALYRAKETGRAKMLMFNGGSDGAGPIAA